jgi:N-acetylmuramic acid 6-phosphate etherase
MALSDCLELAGTFGIDPAQTAMLFPGGPAALLHMTGAPEDDERLAASDLSSLALQPNDVVIAVSASGRTPYTVEIARLARRCGASVVGIANVPESPLLLQSDVPILLDTGPEPIAGSTRMGAGTAQKIALNMLSTLTGLKLGHVHDGYMINLVADNAKLVTRAVRMVAALSNTDTERAADALSRVSGAVKPAILVAAGATPEAALAMLQTHRGHLGPALAEVTG